MQVNMSEWSDMLYRLMCLSGVTCLSVGCCFSQLALCQSK